MDDNIDIRNLVHFSLSTFKDKYAFFEAETGEAAMTIIETEKPDIVLLDIMMPGKPDGFGVLNIIKADPELKHIHVIMVTAKDHAVDEDRGMVRGATMYFIKPFSPQELCSAVESLLNQ